MSVRCRARTSRLLLATLAACGGETNEPASPAAPAIEPYACGDGLAGVSLGGPNEPATCQPIYYCDSASDCPLPLSGSVEPVCVAYVGDVLPAPAGWCSLPCTEAAECPSGLACVAGECIEVTHDPNVACATDADCDAPAGYRCARESCDSEPRCWVNIEPCQLDQPVCGCDGQSYPTSCIFPTAVAHLGPCP